MLGTDITTGEEIILPLDTLHTYILGNTGTGKTTLERSLIAGSIEAGHGVCVIDPHGERDKCLVDCVLSDLPHKRLKDAILFDINTPDYVPGLKPFYCRDKDDHVAVQDTISTALNMFEKVYNVDRNTMARIIAYIESLIYLFIYDESLTLLDILDLLDANSKYDSKRVKACTHLPPSPGFDFARKFWTETFSQRAKKGYNQDSEIFGTLMKFRELSSHLLWPMFCQKTNTLDLREIMAKQKILLVKLNGNWEDITSLIGSYLIGQIKDAAFHRSRKDPPFYLYVDEFQRMASRDFLTLFSEARGGNVHVTIDHQVSSQLDEDMKETIRQASCFVCFHTTDITAASVAGMFDTTPPPGEWIYEKIMRRAGRNYQVEVWDSPQAEAEYLLLGETQAKTQQVVAFEENKYRQLPAPSFFPIRMTPKLWKVAESLMQWFRPYHDDPAVEAYLKNLYELVEISNRLLKWTPVEKDHWGKRYFSSQPFAYRKYYLDFHRNLQPYIYKYSDKKLDFTRYYQYAIKQHIKANTPYRFPLQFPCEFEGDNLRLDAELVEEIKNMYAPFKRKAYYVFDVEAYNEFSIGGYLEKTDGSEPNSYCFFHPWQGPYFPSNSDWLKIIKWFYDKVYAKQEEKQTAITTIEERRQQLYRTSHRIETRTEWLDWYEPEPILEWEYVAQKRSLYRDFGMEFPVGENCKYRARLGPPPYGSDEVANRTANQIKQLAEYTARVRIPAGEYTIMTTPPKEVLQEHALNKRIEQLYQQNITDGFLRRRADVEHDFLSLPVYPVPQMNQNGVPAIPLPAKKRK